MYFAICLLIVYLFFNHPLHITLAEQNGWWKDKEMRRMPTNGEQFGKKHVVEETRYSGNSKLSSPELWGNYELLVMPVKKKTTSDAKADGGKADAKNVDAAKKKAASDAKADAKKADAATNKKELTAKAGGVKGGAKSTTDGKSAKTDGGKAGTIHGDNKCTILHTTYFTRHTSRHTSHDILHTIYFTRHT